jgi:hypothetical protein
MKRVNLALVRECMNYDPDTGSLTWNRRPEGHFKRRRTWLAWNKRFAGKEVGGVHTETGYRTTKFDNGVHLVHRLIWLWVHGSCPEQIDHINHIRTDNRLANLRAADPVINGSNISLPADNTSGRVGVYWVAHRGTWAAKICHRRKKMHIGTFVAFEDACRARADAEVRLGFHANHGLPANDNTQLEAAA